MQRELTVRIGKSAKIGWQHRRMADIATVGILFVVTIAAVLSRHLMYI